MPAETSEADHFVQPVKTFEVTILPGDIRYFDLHFQIEPGYHLIASTGKEGNLLPVEVQIPGTASLQFFPEEWSAPDELYLEGFESPVPVFEQIVAVKVLLRAGETLARGRYHRTASLFYQACDDQKCFFPRELRFPLLIQVK